ncbi:MAG TPA: hypothetical protein VF918_18770 [Anaerolineales bacterium]
MSETRASHRLSSFFAVMFVAAFGGNFLWEMLQMSVYAGMTDRAWRPTVLSCTFASLGDAALNGAFPSRDPLSSSPRLTSVPFSNSK